MKMNECFAEGKLVAIAPSIRKAQKSLENAQDFVKQAQGNLPLKNYRLVLFCTYTAMFHAARALLFRDGVKERSHVCLISYLKGKYPNLKSSIDTMDAYRCNRHSAIYGLDYLLSEPDAREAIKDAKDFLGTVQKLV